MGTGNSKGANINGASYKSDEDNNSNVYAGSWLNKALDTTFTSVAETKDTLVDGVSTAASMSSTQNAIDVALAGRDMVDNTMAVVADDKYASTNDTMGTAERVREEKNAEFSYLNYMSDKSGAVGSFIDACISGNLNKQSGVITYDSAAMKGLAQAFTEMFERFATSFKYCDQIIDEILQNGETSAILSPTYGAELKNFWEDNASDYADFPTLAGNWVDLILYTCQNNDAAIQEIIAQYKSKS